MFAVIAGLDPAIHRERVLRSVMDTRVKPAYDETRTEAADSWAVVSAAALSFAQIAS
jgi:hypothetical protein